MLEVEGQQRFSREEDLPVAGERAACRARAAASKRADGRTPAAAGKPANNRSQTRSAACEERRTLAFALFHAVNAVAGYRIAAPVSVNPFQTNLKQRAALEVAEGFGVDYSTVGAGTPGNHRLAVDHDIVGNGRGEGIAGLADPGAKILVKANMDARSGRQINHCWRRRRLRSGRTGRRGARSRPCCGRRLWSGT
ncbi:hypothetical protein SBA5_290102 [Candidatus Sulfotelmatomonas gaucii]|uniref:Uncharacterized protein n=1 Tax=Candidatus Sulfuritelmatomonas gaucii TaxID=2043161 RepID=A0A2N9LAF6_9BACT|nr:hypothetical protein SBA5_290102 [Candidatus Sulfotelmatomonas gaucii]